MGRERLDRDLTESGRWTTLPHVHGLSERAVTDYCDAIEFGIHKESPTESEVYHLRKVLTTLAREAHASAMLPEHLLMALKYAWSSICNRRPDPDMHDPGWEIVVRESIRAYDATRP
jgi:hypothetical protein